MTISAYPSRFGSGPPLAMRTPVRRQEPATEVPLGLPRGVYWTGAVLVSLMLWWAAIWAVLQLI